MATGSAWLEFYRRFMACEEASSFVESCGAQTPPNNAAKMIMHQCQRLVTLAEDVSDKYRHPLQLLFLMICAEAVAKLADNKLSKSRNAVQTFFSKHVSQSGQDLIAARFRRHSGVSHQQLSVEEAVNVLYDVRCSVAHEGNYWSFNLGSGSTWTLTGFSNVQSQLAMDDLIRIIVEGSVKAARTCLSSGVSS